MCVCVCVCVCVCLCPWIYLSSDRTASSAPSSCPLMATSMSVGFPPSWCACRTSIIASVFVIFVLVKQVKWVHLPHSLCRAHYQALIFLLHVRVKRWVVVAAHLVQRLMCQYLYCGVVKRVECLPLRCRCPSNFWLLHSRCPLPPSPA